MTFAALILGAFLGWWRSYSLLDPYFLVVFFCSPVILAGPALARSYEKPNALLASVLRSCITVLAAYFVGLLWINVQWPDVLLPPVGAFVAAIALGGAVTAFGSMLMLLALRRFRAPVALRTFRFAVLGGVLLYLYFPASWSVAITELIVERGVAAVAFVLALIVGVADVVIWRSISGRLR